MKIKNIVYIIALLMICTYGFSQKINCATSIKDAEEMYKNGDYDNVIPLLNSVIKQCSLSKREKEDAYILLTQAYLEKEKFQEANHLLVKILNNDPNFKLKENLYQEDFYSYFNKIKIRPMLSAGAKLGLNFPTFSVKKIYSVYDSVDYSAKYKSTTGYQYGAFVEYQFYKGFAAKVEGAFSKMGYTRNIKGNSMDQFDLNYNEELKSFETSLCLKKYFLHKQYKPFVYVGGYYSSIYKATANIALSYQLKDILTPDMDAYNVTKSNIDVIGMRNKNRLGMLFGAGFSYKIKNFLVTADGGYRFDIGKHLINSDKRFNNQDVVFNYYYIDNDVTLKRLDASLSVAYIFKYSIKSK